MRRSILRHLVARRCGDPVGAVEVGYDPGGAPLILAPDQRLFCSVAARGDLAAIALADTPVGIDLEPIEEGDIPSAVLADNERAWLAGLDPAARSQAFLHLWTVKEAYLKARRSGLNADPASVSVSAEPPHLVHGPHRQALPSGTWFQSVVDGRSTLAACVVLDLP